MKKIVNNIIAYFGYGIVKIQKKRIIKKDCIVNVGNYNLKLPSTNPLVYTYKTNKKHSSEIGRITDVLLQKYPSLFYVDIGANVGDTLLLVKSIDRDINAICIEGDETSFRYLKENSTNFKNVFLFNSFLGESNITVNATIDKVGWNNTIIPDTDGDETISLVTLDSLVSQQFNADILVKFIKIDTEGFDTIIIRGALNIIKKNNPVIYFEYNRSNMSPIKEDGLGTLLSMSRLGYTKVLFFDDEGRYLLQTELTEKKLITELHNYCDGSGLISYLNICLISKEDEDLVDEIIEKESLFYCAGLS